MRHVPELPGQAQVWRQRCALRRRSLRARLGAARREGRETNCPPKRSIPGPRPRWAAIGAGHAVIGWAVIAAACAACPAPPSASPHPLSPCTHFCVVPPAVVLSAGIRKQSCLERKCRQPMAAPTPGSGLRSGPIVVDFRNWHFEIVFRSEARGGAGSVRPIRGWPIATFD